MGQKNQNTMFKNKQSLLENLILKRGEKWKTEALIKKTFKNLQKNCNKKPSLSVVKNAIIISATGVNVNKQTLKRGKKKRVVQTTAFLISERARFCDSWKNIVKSTRLNKTSTSFSKDLSKKLIELNSNNLKKNTLMTTIHKKYGFKFKW